MALDENWRKSHKSNTNGACVEVRKINEEVQVRNSRKPELSFASFTEVEWDAFLDGVRNGEFNL